jgi:hypothetical protein
LGQIWAVDQIRNSTGTKSFETFIKLPQIVRRCIVQMHGDIFHGPSPAMCAEIFNQIRPNVITKECTIVCSTFEYIGQTVDSVYGQNDRNQALIMSIFVWFFLKSHLWMQLMLAHVDISNRIRICPLLKHYKSYSLHLSPGLQTVRADVSLFRLSIAVQRASTRSPCKGLPDCVLSQNSILSSVKRWYHLYTVDKTKVLGHILIKV